MADKIKITSAYDSGGSAGFVTQINPASVKIGKKISYEKIQSMVSDEYISRYKNHEPSTLSFEIYMDDTGAVPASDGSSILQRIEQLETAVYTIQTESKEPGYVVLVWGTLIFHGRAESIDYDYSLFAPDGTPLRVKISLSFVGSFENSSSQGTGSSQAASTVTFTSGDSLADYCDSIYGDASYCADVAMENGLDSIRGILPGTVIAFPSKSRT